LQSNQSYQAGGGGGGAEEFTTSDESLFYKILCSPYAKYLAGEIAGLLENTAFNLINFTGDDAYFNAGKKLGQWIGNIVSVLSIVKGIANVFKFLPKSQILGGAIKDILKGIKNGFTLRRWIFQRSSSISRTFTIKIVKFTKTFTINIPAGIETIVGTTEEGEPIWGNIIKIAKNEKFGGWYLGWGSVPGQVTKLENGKIIQKGLGHWYFNGKTAIWNKNIMQYAREDAPTLEQVANELDKEVGSPSNKANLLSNLFLPLNLTLFASLSGSSTCGSNIGEARIAGDPNFMNVDPLNYTNGNLTNLFTVGFENEPNATLPAFNITVIIHLDPHYNSSTVMFQAASNITALSSFTVNKTNNVIVARFTNINLPPDNPPPIGQGFILSLPT
jgi:hypothetical protein